MTTGTNLQLNYNEDTDSWSYENVNYEYAPSSGNSWSGFTSPDPDFEYVPTTPETPDTDTDTDPCPPGYIFDDVLKQCVPDPDYRAPNYYGAPAPDDTSGIDSTGGNDFVEFDASTPEGRQAMFERGKDKGYFDTTSTAKGGAYEFQGAPQAPDFLPPLVKGLAQFGQDRQYNRYINELNKENNKRLAEGRPAILAQAVGFFGLSKTFQDWGNSTLAIHSPNYTTGFQGPYRTETTDRNIGGVNVDSMERELRKEKLKQEQAKTEKARAEADMKKMEQLDKGESIRDSSGDTYTKVTSDDRSTGGGSKGFSFTPKDPKPSVSQKTQSGQDYGTGRGGTASKQQEMKKRDTRPSGPDLRTR